MNNEKNKGAATGNKQHNMDHKATEKDIFVTGLKYFCIYCNSILNLHNIQELVPTFGTFSFHALFVEFYSLPNY
jgi:hypothetical protein